MTLSVQHEIGQPQNELREEGDQQQHRETDGQEGQHLP